MSFLDAIRDTFCHQTVGLTLEPHGKPCIQCQECGAFIIPDIYKYIQDICMDNYTGGCSLAQAYSEWSKDTNVCVNFVINKLDGILSKWIKGQTLSRVINSIKILKALNAPFTQGGVVEPLTVEMEQFLGDCANMIASNRSNEGLQEHEQTLLDNMLSGLNTVMNNQEFQNNKFGYYFDSLVPYVKACEENWKPLPPLVEDRIAVKELENQLQRSQFVRKQFGKYNISFELFHVLAAGYACCVDLDALANWLLDLVARVCRGHFFWKNYKDCKFVKETRNMLETEFKYNRNIELYYVIRNMKNGEGVEALSQNIKNYALLERAFKQKLRGPKDILEMLGHQLFPSVVFENHMDNLAFTLALAFVASKMDQRTGEVKTGMYKKAKQLSKVVYLLMRRVQEYENGTPIQWTMDAMKLFMAGEDIEKSLKVLAEVVFEPLDNDNME